MSEEQKQIRQLKEAINSSEGMLLEQSKIIVSLNSQIENLQQELNTQKVKRQEEQTCFKEKLKNQQEQYNTLLNCQSNILKQLEEVTKEYESYQTLTEADLQKKEAQILQLTTQSQDSHKLNEELQSTISKLESMLIEAKMKVATQSGELDVMKKEVVVLKRSSSELENLSRRSSNDSSGSSGFFSSITSDKNNRKLQLTQIDEDFRQISIQQNHELLKNLQGISQSGNLILEDQEFANPEDILFNSLQQNQESATSNENGNSVPIFSQQQLNKMESDNFNSFSKQKSAELQESFSKSCILMSSSSAKDNNNNSNNNNFLSRSLNLSSSSFPSSPQMAPTSHQIQLFCEQVIGRKFLNVILSQAPPSSTYIIFSQHEQIQYDKVFQEAENPSQKKVFQKELDPILSSLYLYSDWKGQTVQQVTQNLLIKKGPLPQSLRKKVWPYIFDKGLQINQNLQKLLEKYHVIIQFIITKIIVYLNQYMRPDIGYVQGMAYPASVLLLILCDSYLAFKYLINLICGSNFLTNLYKFKISKIKVYLATFDYFLNSKLPNVTKHLNKLSISSDIFLIEWFYTLYSRAFALPTVKQVINMQTTQLSYLLFDLSKIWDMMLAFGEITYYRVGVAIFQCIEKELITKNFDESLFLIRNCTSKIDSEQLLKLIYTSKISTEQMLKKYQVFKQDPSLTHSILSGNSPLKKKKKEDNNLDQNGVKNFNCQTPQTNGNTHQETANFNLSESVETLKREISASISDILPLKSPSKEDYTDENNIILGGKDLVLNGIHSENQLTNSLKGEEELFSNVQILKSGVTTSQSPLKDDDASLIESGLPIKVLLLKSEISPNEQRIE